MKTFENKKELLDTENFLLDKSKEIMKEVAKKHEQSYYDGERITTEELDITTTILRHLGHLK